MVFQGLTNWRGAAIPKPEEVFGADSEQYDGRSAHLEPGSAHLPEFASGSAEHVAFSSLADLLNRDTDARRQQHLKPLAKAGKLRFAFPTANLTAVFDRTVAPLLAQLHANLHQSRTLATLRDTLLPKLLSGQLSVVEATGKRDLQVQPQER